MCHAERFSTPLLPGLAASEWPWWVHQLVSHVATVKSVYERASVLDMEVPPRYIWWDSKELEAYFEQGRKKK